MNRNKAIVIGLICFLLIGCKSKKSESLQLQKRFEMQKAENDMLRTKKKELEEKNQQLEELNKELQKKNQELTIALEELQTNGIKEQLKDLQDFSTTLDNKLQEAINQPYYNPYNKFFEFDFMVAVVNSRDKHLIGQLLDLINLKADEKDDYNLFCQRGDPLTIAVGNNDKDIVSFIADKAPQFVTLVHNGARGGCQDWEILDRARTDEMKTLLISLGANTQINYGDDGWLIKDSVIYNSIKDAENGNGEPGIEGKAVYAKGRIYIFSKEKNTYEEMFILEKYKDNKDVYARTSDVYINPDL